MRRLARFAHASTRIKPTNPSKTTAAGTSTPSTVGCIRTCPGPKTVMPRPRFNSGNSLARRSRQGIHGGLRLCDRDVWSETGPHGGDRQPEVGHERPATAIESFGAHADNGNRLTAHADRLADDTRIGAEPGTPCVVADDGVVPSAHVVEARTRTIGLCRARCQARGNSWR